MKVIYDILNDSERTKAVRQQIKSGKIAYRTKWGMFGTSEWINNLKNDNLIEIIEGKISRLYFSGHNDFAEFEIDNEVSKFNFERLGIEEFYKIGLNIRIECTRAKYILPISGFEESLTALKITVLE